MTTKYIFVTGGVVSSLGKGVASASIGAIVKAKPMAMATVHRKFFIVSLLKHSIGVRDAQCARNQKAPGVRSTWAWRL